MVLQVRKSLSNSMVSHPRWRDSSTTPTSKSPPPPPPKKLKKLFARHSFSCTRINSFYQLGSNRHEALGVNEWMSHAPFSMGNLCNLRRHHQMAEHWQLSHPSSAAIFMVLLHRFICKYNRYSWAACHNAFGSSFSETWNLCDELQDNVDTHCHNSNM